MFNMVEFKDKINKNNTLFSISKNSNRTITNSNTTMEIKQYSRNINQKSKLFKLN